MHTSQRHHGAEYIELSAGTSDHHHHSTDLDDVDDPPDDPSSNERQAMLPPTKRRYSDVESQPLASLNDSRRLSSSSTPFLVDSDPVINNDKDSIIETSYTSTMAREVSKKVNFPIPFMDPPLPSFPSLSLSFSLTCHHFYCLLPSWKRLPIHIPSPSFYIYSCKFSILSYPFFTLPHEDYSFP